MDLFSQLTGLREIGLESGCSPNYFGSFFQSREEDPNTAECGRIRGNRQAPVDAISRHFVGTRSRLAGGSSLFNSFTMATASSQTHSSWRSWAAVGKPL